MTRAVTKPKSRKKTPRARKKPVTGAPSLRWKGRVLPLIQERNGVWRVRSRAKAAPIDIGLGTSDLAQARDIALQKLAEIAELPTITRGSTEELVTVYKTLPKKCNDDSAARNIARLRSVARVAFGKELDALPIAKIPDLWHTYVAKRQGRASADYSRRERMNLSVNAAMRQAAAVFRKKLLPHYRRAGLILPADVATVEFLPDVTALIPKPKADDAAMIAAWEGLRETDINLWLTVGLARFAGLRLGEILAAKGKWFERRGDAVVVALQDRLEDTLQTKTGRRYSAVILNAALAEYVAALPAEASVLNGVDIVNWAAREPQNWLRPFVGGAPKPLHRLRGLYADHLVRETEQAILARQAGIAAAQAALGHTTAATTERHYLSHDDAL